MLSISYESARFRIRMITNTSDRVMNICQAGTAAVHGPGEPEAEASGSDGIDRVAKQIVRECAGDTGADE